MLVFTNTNYKRIESYLCDIFIFNHVKISQISGYPKGVTAAHYLRNVWNFKVAYFMTHICYPFKIYYSFLKYCHLPIEQKFRLLGATAIILC